MQKKQVELLAPAGNAEGFYGAIHAGADAVYLGGDRFGARAYADNFTMQELIHCIRYAHLWGRKVYLTVNTLVKENEFQDIYEYLLPYYQAGLDGVIVQDIGVFAYIRDHFPSMELHVSTQMTLTGIHGAKLLQDMGACRIVPARELSLKEIRHIKEQTGLAIEAFIHGAMCYCYSGQCLFSSILGGRSGNRGRCAQPCRLPYQVETFKGKFPAQGKRSPGKTDECYPLSLKDMCTIEYIPELIDAGIDSFKIEGRMKKPEYTAGVTAIYRKYIDSYLADLNSGAYNRTGKFEIDKRDMQRLSHLYIRSEIQNGYYHKHNGRDMVTLSTPAYSGNDDVLLAEIRQRFLEWKPKQSIDIYADFTTGQNASLTLLCGEVSVTLTGDIVDTASKQPVTMENIAKQLGKLGDSIFMTENMEITVSEDAFYPLRAINELRREAVTQLENALLEQNGFPVQREDAAPKFVTGQDTENSKQKIDSFKQQSVTEEINSGRLFLSIRRKEQLQAVFELVCKNENAGTSGQNAELHHISISRIYLDTKLFETQQESILSMCKGLAGHCELVIALPYVIREKDTDFLQEMIYPLLPIPRKADSSDIFSGVQVRSLEGMGIVKDMWENHNFNGKVYTDAGFYIWNNAALAEWKNAEMAIDEFCLPFELKGVEQRSLLHQGIPCEKVVYGRMPMMLTANCVANTTSGCQKGSGEQMVRLIDRYHKTFPVELNCRQCMNIIYNSVPLSLHGEVGKWREHADMRLDFTVETAQETKEVAQYFADIISRKNAKEFPKPPYAEYTTGHEKRGVE